MKESREEIRARLLRDSNVIENIQLRAYEIWIIRGRVDGRHHEDWSLAENEVLNFLVEHELRKASEETVAPVETVAATETQEVAAPVETVAETGNQEVQAEEAAPAKKTRKAAAPKAVAPKVAAPKTATTKAATTKAATTSKKTVNAKASDKAEAVTPKAAAKKPAAKLTTAKKPATKKAAKSTPSATK